VLFVRSLSPTGTGERQEAVVEALETLTAAGAVDGYEVRVWGDRVPVDCATARTRAGREVLDRVEEFRDWADRNGASLEDVFEPCASGTLAEAGPREALSLPSLLLAEYDGEALVGVTPRTENGTCRTICDRLCELDAAESGRVDAALGVVH
jgi:hypothetical protein